MIPEIPKSQKDFLKETKLLSNLSNLAKIPTHYYSYESGLKLLHSLAKIEFKNSFKKESQSFLPREIDSLGYTNDSERFGLDSLKRHSSFSLDHFNKGVYKLRKFEKNNDFNIETLFNQQNNISKVNFLNLIPKTPEEIIEPHMVRLINLHFSLFESSYEKGLQEIEKANGRDDALLDAFSRNINTLLKTANFWLQKELLRDSSNLSRYFHLFDKILDLLNNPESILQIISSPSEQDNDWVEFVRKIPIYNEKFFIHMGKVCEKATEMNVLRSSFLEIFKKTILNNLERKEFWLQGLKQFLNLINREAFEIVNNSFWPVNEFREYIILNAEQTLETIKMNGMSLESLNNNLISDVKIKDYTIKYLSVLSKQPLLIENLMISFSELLPIAQQVILDKFEILSRKKFLDYISNETLISIFRNSKRNEKLIIKFIEKYRKSPESLNELVEILLPEINNFCLENNYINGLSELIILNNENEFSRIQNQLILKGNEAFFNDIIPILLEKKKNLAQNLFIQIHLISQQNDLFPDQLSLISKIYDTFFKNENIFFEKATIFEIFNSLLHHDPVPSLIMRTIHKVFRFFFKKESFGEIFDGLIEVVRKLIERNMMENEKIWSGMKKFFILDIRCKNLLQALPENYKKDFFND